MHAPSANSATSFRIARSTAAAGPLVLALLTTLAGCGAAAPRQRTEVEKICATSDKVACAQAKVIEHRQRKAAKELQDAGLLD